MTREGPVIRREGLELRKETGRPRHHAIHAHGFERRDAHVLDLRALGHVRILLVQRIIIKRGVLKNARRVRFAGNKSAVDIHAPALQTAGHARAATCETGEELLAGGGRSDDGPRLPPRPYRRRS